MTGAYDDICSSDTGVEAAPPTIIDACLRCTSNHSNSNCCQSGTYFTRDDRKFKSTWQAKKEAKETRCKMSQFSPLPLPVHPNEPSSDWSRVRQNRAEKPAAKATRTTAEKAQTERSGDRAMYPQRIVLWKRSQEKQSAYVRVNDCANGYWSQKQKENREDFVVRRWQIEKSEQAQCCYYHDPGHFQPSHILQQLS